MQEQMRRERQLRTDTWRFTPPKARPGPPPHPRGVGCPSHSPSPGDGGTVGRRDGLRLEWVLCLPCALLRRKSTLTLQMLITRLMLSLPSHVQTRRALMKGSMHSLYAEPGPRPRGRLAG